MLSLYRIALKACRLRRFVTSGQQVASDQELLEAVMHLNGITLDRASFTPSIAGLLWLDPCRCWRIACNRDYPAGLQNLSIARAVGHFFLHRAGTTLIVCRLGVGTPQELEAAVFSLWLLAPSSAGPSPASAGAGASAEPEARASCFLPGSAAWGGLAAPETAFSALAPGCRVRQAGHLPGGSGHILRQER